MKKLSIIGMILLCILLTGCGSKECEQHIDEDKDELCDKCEAVVVFEVNLYSVNDLHGKFADTDEQPGVDEMSAYFQKVKNEEENVIILSAGDMWQGSAESNLTNGFIITEWMNEMGFAAMTIGNHEYDWGEEPIEANYEIADFPFLAINIYDRETNELVNYCQPSTIVDCGEVQVGIIGAIGDVYSSIAPDKVEDVYFKVGDELTQLVQEESTKLREEGADCIIYVLHDGYGQSTEAEEIGMAKLESYYDVALSNGYVDLVFESHTHQAYAFEDIFGVYHLQHKGDNSNGISYAEVKINIASGRVRVKEAKLVRHSKYTTLEGNPIVETLLEKYDEQIGPAYETLGINASQRESYELTRLVANLYYSAGVEKWGDDYDIVLGGGFLNVRNPYHLKEGEVNYAQLQTLLPFDNELVLCSIKGRDLIERFFENDDDRYSISYDNYGAQVRESVELDKTYYIVTDTYSSSYGPNHLTEIARYGSGIYARDLLADYVRAGRLE